MTPIQIPRPSSAKTEIVDLPETRRAGTPYTLSQAWASDTELSPISGMSEARNALASSIAFDSRTPASSIYGWGQEGEGRRRTNRQDSATLPKESVWETVPRSNPVSRKSSARSMKRRRRELGSLELPPLEALPSLNFLDVNVTLAETREAPALAPPPRTDSIQDRAAYETVGGSPQPRHQPGMAMPSMCSSGHRPIHRVHPVDIPMTPPMTGLTTATIATVSTPSKYSTSLGSASLSPAKVTTPSSATSAPSSASQDKRSLLEDLDFGRIAARIDDALGHGVAPMRELPSFRPM